MEMCRRPGSHGRDRQGFVLFPPPQGAQVGVMGNCPAKRGGTTAGAAGASWRRWCSRRQPAGCRPTAPGWTPQACSRSARSPRPSPPPCSRRLVYRLRGRQNHCDVQDPARILVAGQLEGIALAEARGACPGRKPALTPGQAELLRIRASAGEPKTAVARGFGISRQTLTSIRHCHHRHRRMPPVFPTSVRTAIFELDRRRPGRSCNQPGSFRCSAGLVLPRHFVAQRTLGCDKRNR